MRLMMICSTWSRSNQFILHLQSKWICVQRHLKHRDWERVWPCPSLPPVEMQKQNLMPERVAPGRENYHDRRSKMNMCNNHDVVLSLSSVICLFQKGVYAIKNIYINACFVLSQMCGEKKKMNFCHFIICRLHNSFYLQQITKHCGLK